MLRRPWDGLPVAWPGGIDVVYDTVGAPDALEVGLDQGTTGAVKVAFDFRPDF